RREDPLPPCAPARVAQEARGAGAAEAHQGDRWTEQIFAPQTSQHDIRHRHDAEKVQSPAEHVRAPLVEVRARPPPHPRLRPLRCLRPRAEHGVVALDDRRRSQSLVHPRGRPVLRRPPPRGPARRGRRRARVRSHHCTRLPSRQGRLELMELPRSLSFVSYAVNGRGLGHLSRQVAIQRWLRRYAAFAGVRSEHWFLTTSEADTLLFHEGFAGFKLPSKAVVGEAGVPKPHYLALAKQWVWHSVALLRPDLFIVDTFPGGSFQELVGVLDLCRHPALVLRPVRPEFARRPAFRAMAGLYERVLVPSREQDEPGLADALGLPGDRLRFV